MTERQIKMNEIMDNPANDMFDKMTWLANDLWDNSFGELYSRYGYEHKNFLLAFFSGSIGMLAVVGKEPDATFQEKDSVLMEAIVDPSWRDERFGGNP